MFDLHIRYLDDDNESNKHLIAVATDDEACEVAEQVKRGGFVITEKYWITVVPAHRVTQVCWPTVHNKTKRGDKS